MYVHRAHADRRPHIPVFDSHKHRFVYTVHQADNLHCPADWGLSFVGGGKKRRKKNNSQVTNRATLQQLGDCLNPPRPSCPGGARESTDDITTKGPTKASIPLSAVTAVLIFSPASTRQNLSRSVSLTPSDCLPALLSPSRQPRLFLTSQKTNTIRAANSNPGTMSVFWKAWAGLTTKQSAIYFRYVSQRTPTPFVFCFFLRKELATNGFLPDTGHCFQSCTSPFFILLHFLLFI